MGALKRGLRNTFRNSMRAVGIILILTVAFAVSITMLIARDAVDKKINSVKANTGTTITVSPAGFFGFTGGGNPLTTAEMTKIAAIPHVTKVESELSQTLSSSETSLTAPERSGSLGNQFGGHGFNFPGASGFSGSSSYTPPIRVIGTNEPGTALIGGANGGGTETLSSGTTYGSDSSADVAILGKALASKNKLVVGDTFTAWSTTIKVVGIYNAGSTFANDEVLMPLATVQTLADQKGDVTGATVTVDTLGHVSQVQKKINTLLGSKGSATSESSIVSAEISPLNSVQSIATYTLIGSAIAAGIILLLSMLMIVRERRREIGVLKAIGAPNRSVVGQFVTEALSFTVIGGLVGIVVGALVGSPVTSALVKGEENSGSTPFGPGGFQRPSGSGSSFPHFGGGLHTSAGDFANSFSQIHAGASWSTLVIGLAIVLGIAIVGSSVAVGTIVRVRPAEVLRSE